MTADRRRIEFYVDAEGKHRWNRKAGNRKIVAESGQGYKEPDAAYKGLKAAYDGFDVVIRDSVWYFSGKVADGSYANHHPKLKNVDIRLILSPKMEQYLLHVWNKRYERLQKKG